ncbi:glycerophosphodiester phosphodiesterase family protein [Jannaschia pohangensis]|uniref:Glycerophosphoryl diester phosphodiesterase n=1 Tax=Jannaschia pohangensis TaxID=390807 RepID=A0A1I3TZ62_9RHOB|nr:glycerophosphodiester phosphodiesterase family protein [Jannaschia pohangensis]SFJ74841.1 Glycerophosphoryl diester phosphodiesterase [Jannaschia pohangensis]
MKLPDSFLSPGYIAHRGLHDRADGRPENSMAAFQAAIDRGFAIELDVQPSSDGVPMAFHDYKLERLTAQTGWTHDKSATELSGITLSGGPAGVPRLSEVLTLVAGRVPLLIEIKDRDGEMGTNVGPVETAVMAALAGYDGDVAVMSFNPHSVACFQREAPHLPRGIVTSGYRTKGWKELSEPVRDHLRDIPDFDRVGACFISHEVAELGMPRVAELKAQGVPILCWTVKSAAQEAEARKVADAVTFEGYLP